MWTFRVIYYIAIEKKDTCMWVTIHFSIFYILLCTLLSFMKHINLLRIKWEKLHSFKIGIQSIAAAVLWAACLGSVVTAVSTTAAVSTTPTTAPWLCLQPECLDSLLPRPFASAPPLPGIILLSLELATRHIVSFYWFQFQYRLSREALCPPDLQQHRHSEISALFSIPHLMSSIGENRFSGAGLTLQLSLDVPLASTNCFTGHQPPTRHLRLWENVTPKYYFAVVPEHRQKTLQTRKILTPLPPSWNGWFLLLCLPQPWPHSFFFNLFWPPHDMGS